MGTRVYTACGCPGSCQDAVGRLRPCPPSASLLPKACWGSSPAWRHRRLECAEQPSPSTKKLAHPQQGRHRAAAAGAGFFFPMEPRCPELRGLLPTVPTCSVCPDGCPHAPCVLASPSCAKPAWSRPQQPPASARPLKMLLSILPHFLTPLPSLSALGRWDKNSVFLQEGNEGDVASSACQQQSPAFPNRCCAAPAKWSRPAPAILSTRCNVPSDSCIPSTPTSRNFCRSPSRRLHAGTPASGTASSSPRGKEPRGGTAPSFAAPPSRGLPSC